MIPLFKVAMHPEVGERVTETLLSGYVGEGPRVAEFEAGLGRLLGIDPPPLGVNSCTAAIDLALHLCGVGPGDEVITTPMTCSATNGPIVTRGARPVWADIDPVTGLIDPVDVGRKVRRANNEGRDLKAIIAVDWGGRSCNYRVLRTASQEIYPRIPIIQDAAHRLSLPAQHGDYVCWSFGPIKHLTCGGYGGALLTPEPQRDRARLLRWHGLDRLSKADFRCEQDIEEAGYRYHLTDDLASVGLANLEIAPQNVERARANARFYSEALIGIPGIQLQPFDPACDYWLYTILADDRDGLIAHLAERGIASSPVHTRNDHHTAYARAAGDCGPLPGVDSFAAKELAVPVGWWVGERERLEIAVALVEWGRRTANRKEALHA